MYCQYIVYCISWLQPEGSIGEQGTNTIVNLDFYDFHFEKNIIVNLESCNSQWNDIENPDTKCDVNFIMAIFGWSIFQSPKFRGMLPIRMTLLSYMADQIIPDLSTKKPYDSVWSSVFLKPLSKLGTLNLGSDMKFISTIKTVGREVRSMRIWECRITRSLIEAENNDCMRSTLKWPHDVYSLRTEVISFDKSRLQLENILSSARRKFIPTSSLDCIWERIRSWWTNHISSLGNIWPTEHAHMAPWVTSVHVFSP